MIAAWVLVLLLRSGGNGTAVQIPMESSVMCDNARDSATKNRYVETAFCLRAGRDYLHLAPN